MTTFIDDFSKEVWESTYKDYKDSNVDDNFRRVAKAIASVEETEELRNEWETKFYDMLSDFKGVPAGRILANAGTEFKGTTLMNCFVAPALKHDIDSLDKIIDNLKNFALTLKSEGGIGANFCLKFDERLFVIRDNKERYIKIEDVIKGDFVYSDDNKLHKVEETLSTIKDNMITLMFDTGETITCTTDHPFYVVRNDIKCWVLAKDILETDDIITLN